MKYIERITNELLEDDGFAVLARGIGVELVFYNIVRGNSTPQRLVFVLNANDHLQKQVNDRLERESTPESPIVPLKTVTNTTTSTEREALYLEGGCISVTNRILIVDFLNTLIPFELISGIVIFNAHRVNEKSTEAFILRVFRQHNKTGFIKALSDRPTDLLKGFFQVEKVMRNLFVKRLHLWPRFHVAVERGLFRKGNGQKVIELYQQMTPLMIKLQTALVELIGACLIELKGSNKELLGTLTLEKGLSVYFDHTTRRILDPVWHKVSIKTKNLLSDLSELRKCLSYMISCDCVTFYRFLLSVRKRARDREAGPSLWLFTEASNTLFEVAKSRVFEIHIEGNEESKPSKKKQKLRRGQSASSQPGPAGKKLKVVLESNPKWKLLMEVLLDIKAQCEKTLRVGKDKDAKNAGSGRVLILCKDIRACRLVARVVRAFQIASSKGSLQNSLELPDNFLQPAWKSYLNSLNLFQRQFVGAPSSSAQSGASAKPPARLQHDWQLLKQELERLNEQQILQWQLADEAAGDQEYQAFLKKIGGPRGADTVKATEGGVTAEPGAGNADSSPQAKVSRPEGAPPPGGKAVRSAKSGARGGKGGKGGKGSGAKEKAPSTPAAQDRGLVDIEALEQEVEDLSQSELSLSQEARARAGLGGKAVQEVAGAAEALLRRPAQGSMGLKDAKDAKQVSGTVQLLGDHMGATSALGSVWVHQGASECSSVLQRLRPDTVVLYDPELLTVRLLELHQAENQAESQLQPGGGGGKVGGPKEMRVYFMMYDKSMEEQRFLAAVKAEKEAFEGLIHNKAHMVVLADQDGKAHGAGQAAPASPGKTRVKAGSRARGPGQDLGADDGVGIRTLTYAAPAPQASSRLGGHVPESAQQVIVDMREFRSTLPGELHSKGIAVVPVTLEVGDYILTPDVCVERKSLSDLMGSFPSGRLYNQMEQMFRYYKVPVLLIEFDRSKSFSLQSINDIPSEIRSSNIISKMVLLILHFPKMRLIWTHGPHATTATFQAIKRNQHQPSKDTAMVVGTEQQEGKPGSEEDGSSPYTAYDMLCKLPGVNQHNIRSLTQRVNSLKELCQASKQQLGEWMNSRVNAKKTYDFLHKKLELTAT